jgi:predicted AAA+ superfamily ATPase
MLEEYLYKFNPWWSQKYSPPGIEREFYLNQLTRAFSKPVINFLVGLRRVGKTTIMKQLASIAIQFYGEKRVLYCSLDHPVLAKLSILELLREFRKIVEAKSNERLLLLLDEIHARDNFERELKAIYDSEPTVKVIASGSSSLAVKHKSPSLTGRHRDIFVRPLSFSEYLKFKDLEVTKAEGYLYEKYMDNYLQVGGLPEYVLTQDPGYILQMIEDIIYKDIASRYGIKNPAVLKELLLLLSHRIGQRITFNKLGHLLKLSTDTIKQYVGLFEETFMFHIIPKCGSPNEQIYAPKKVYLADNAIASVLAGEISIGALAENLVYSKIKEKGKVCYFMDETKEIDFVVGDEMFEVKYKDELDDIEFEFISNKKVPHIKRKNIISKKLETTKKGVKVIPLWKFVLS